MFSLLLPVENTNIPRGQSETSEGYWMFSELHNVSVASQGSDSEMQIWDGLSLFILGYNKNNKSFWTFYCKNK